MRLVIVKVGNLSNIRSVLRIDDDTWWVHAWRLCESHATSKEPPLGVVCNFGGDVDVDQWDSWKFDTDVFERLLPEGYAKHNEDPAYLCGVTVYASLADEDDASEWQVLAALERVFPVSEDLSPITTMFMSGLVKEIEIPLYEESTHGQGGEAAGEDQLPGDLPHQDDDAGQELHPDLHQERRRGSCQGKRSGTRRT